MDKDLFITLYILLGFSLKAGHSIEFLPVPEIPEEI